jgi:hypothetical protein
MNRKLPHTVETYSRLVPLCEDEPVFTCGAKPDPDFIDAVEITLTLGVNQSPKNEKKSLKMAEQYTRMLFKEYKEAMKVGREAMEKHLMKGTKK